MKRLLLVLVALGATLGFAQSNSVNHTWNITFNRFAYVWINVGDLSFDLTGNPSGSPTYGYLNALSNVYPGTQSGFEACINMPTFSTTSTTYQAVTSGSATGVCYFAPVINSGGSNYDATYDDPTTTVEDFNNVADADLLVLTYDSSWTLNAETTDSIPSGVDLLFYPYAWDPTNSRLIDPNGNSKGLIDAVKLNSSTSTAQLSSGFGSGLLPYAYRVKLTSGVSPWLYLQPVNFALKVDFATALGGGDISSTIQVTYTVSNP